MNPQDDLPFADPSRPDGYAQWLAHRDDALLEAAHKLGLPLGRKVEVWLHGGIRLRGILELAERQLFVSEQDLPKLRFVVDRTTFRYDEMQSCLRQD